MPDRGPIHSCLVASFYFFRLVAPLSFATVPVTYSQYPRTRSEFAASFPEFVYRTSFSLAFFVSFCLFSKATTEETVARARVWLRRTATMSTSAAPTPPASSRKCSIINRFRSLCAFRYMSYSCVDCSSFLNNSRHRCLDPEAACVGDDDDFYYVGSYGNEIIIGRYNDFAYDMVEGGCGFALGVGKAPGRMWASHDHRYLFQRISLDGSPDILVCTPSRRMNLRERKDVPFDICLASALMHFCLPSLSRVVSLTGNGFCDSENNNELCGRPWCRSLHVLELRRVGCGSSWFPG